MLTLNTCSEINLKADAKMAKIANDIFRSNSNSNHRRVKTTSTENKEGNYDSFLYQDRSHKDVHPKETEKLKVHFHLSVCRRENYCVGMRSLIFLEFLGVLINSVSDADKN